MQGYLNLKAYKEFDNANDQTAGTHGYAGTIASACCRVSPPPILTKSLPRG